MKNIYYLGAFPPPFGGVTVKNSNLFTALNKRLNIKKIDFCEIERKNIKTIISFVCALLGKKNIFAIGVAGKNTRKKFCKLLYYINRKAMRKSIIFLMGGSVSHDIAGDRVYQKYISTYKAVYVETVGMKNELENVGLNNIYIYPNCRFRPKENIVREDKNYDKLRCVFFSNISLEKGIDLVINAAKELREIEFHIYGELSKNLAKTFFDSVIDYPNVRNHGVFKGVENEVYEELAKYDIVLLPTRWKHEGVPGVLIEAKIAGVPAIVSDVCYNAEIVKNGVSGIVLKENTVKALTSAIKILDNNRDILHQLKWGARQSADDYYIESYINKLISVLMESDS